MARSVTPLLKSYLKSNLINQGCQHRGFSYSPSLRTGHLKFSEQVKAAIAARQPVVALETTIVTHGMPAPQNIRTALEVEDIVRQSGAVPATIGIIKGQVYIGLERDQIEYLADPGTTAVKTSRHDLAYVLSQGLNGGTTVSGTMVLAHMAGIPVFVTGGIGGVHRGAESTMDISADLTELGRTPVTVVSAGIKSILDIGRTLEYLETQGVCVATYGVTNDFPAFFSRSSGFKAPYHVTSPYQVACMIEKNHELGLQSGSLIAVPIPLEFDTLGQEIETVIQSVVREAQDKGITGKEVTPYILKRVNDLTQGKSLQANIHLIKNNAAVGSAIAVELNKLKQMKGGNSSNVKETSATKGDHQKYHNISTGGKTVYPTLRNTAITAEKNVDRSSKQKKVTVVGCSIVDFTVKVTQPHFKSNGASYAGHIHQSFGGVGRNLADGLSRLGNDTLFLSAVGDDSHRAAFEQHCKHMNLSGVARLPGHRTATYCAVLRDTGHLLFGVQDTNIASQITPQYISSFERQLANSDIVCMDGNITTETIKTLCDICRVNGVPVLFEPTDLLKATKPLQSSAHTAVTLTTPNFNELRAMAEFITGKQYTSIESADDCSCSEVIEESLRLLSLVSDLIPVTMVTLGRHGVLLCSRGDFTIGKGSCVQREGQATVRHYPALPVSDSAPIVSVSGAGDCMVSAFLTNHLEGFDLDTCMTSGLQAAHLSLMSNEAVPVTMSRDVLRVESRVNPTLYSLL